MEILLYILLVWNLTVFCLYGIDKSRAVHNKWRLRELTLVLCAFLMGGMGAILGMVVFNHKTSKLKFRILVPLAVLLNAAAAAVIGGVCV